LYSEKSNSPVTARIETRKIKGDRSRPLAVLKFKKTYSPVGKNAEAQKDALRRKSNEWARMKTNPETAYKGSQKRKIAKGPKKADGNFNATPINNAFQ